MNNVYIVVFFMSKPIVMEPRNPMVPFNMNQNGGHLVFFFKKADLTRKGVLLFCVAIFFRFLCLTT